MTFYRNQSKLSCSLNVNSGNNSWESGDIGDNDGPGCSGRDDGDQTTNEMMVTKPPMRRWWPSWQGDDGDQATKSNLVASVFCPIMSWDSLTQTLNVVGSTRKDVGVDDDDDIRNEIIDQYIAL